MNPQAAAIVSISILFLLMSIGTVTGLYHLELLGFSLTGLEGEATFIVVLGGAGLIYGLSRLRSK